MNVCKKCSAHLENNIAFCPLCGTYIERENRETPPTAFMGNDFKFGYKRKVLRLLDLIAVTAALLASIAALLHLLMGADVTRWWYVYVMTGLIAVKIGVIDMLKKTHYNWRCILADCVIASLAVVFIDFYAFGFNGFSLSFVLPALITAAAVCVTVFTMNGILNPLSAVQAFVILLLTGGAVIALNALLSAFEVLPLYVLPALLAEAAAIICFIVLFVFKYKDLTKAFLAGFKTR